MWIVKCHHGVIGNIVMVENVMENVVGDINIDIDILQSTQNTGEWRVQIWKTAKNVTLEIVVIAKWVLGNVENALKKLENRNAIDMLWLNPWWVFLLRNVVFLKIFVIVRKTMSTKMENKILWYVLLSFLVNNYLVFHFCGFRRSLWSIWVE